MSLVITQSGGDFEPCITCDKCLEQIEQTDAAHITIPVLSNGNSTNQLMFYHDRCDRDKQGWRDLAGLDMHFIELDWFIRQLAQARAI